MAAHVLHFGDDDCHRVSILESAGYNVEQCASLRQFVANLQAGSQRDAIFITERDGASPSDAAAAARSHSPAPLILFRTSNRRAAEKQFDLVVDSLEPPEQWLNEVRATIEKGRRLRADSANLIENSREICLESADARMQSSRQRARSRGESSRKPRNS